MSDRKRKAAICCLIAASFLAIERKKQKKDELENEVESKPLNSTIDDDKTSAIDLEDDEDEENEEENCETFINSGTPVKVEPGLTDEDTITDYHNSNEELRDPLELDIDNVSFKEENNYMDESIKVKVEPDSSDDDINYVSSDNYENDSTEETSKTDIQNIIQIKEDPIEECDKSKKVSVDVPTAINKEIPADKDQQIKTSKPVIRDQNEIRDDCQIFGDFVAGELRNLKSDDNRKKIKRIIQKVIIEISESED